MVSTNEIFMSVYLLSWRTRGSEKGGQRRAPEGGCLRKWASSMTWCRPFAQEKCLTRTCRSSSETASVPSTSSWTAVGAKDPLPRSTIDTDFWGKKKWFTDLYTVREGNKNPNCHLPLYSPQHPNPRWLASWRQTVPRLWLAVLGVSEILTALCSITRLSLTLFLSNILHGLPPPIVSGSYLQAKCNLKMPWDLPCTRVHKLESSSYDSQPKWQVRTWYRNQSN